MIFRKFLFSGIVGLSALLLLAGCNEELQETDTYKVKETITEYKGQLEPQEIQTDSRDEQKLAKGITEGVLVQKDDILTQLSGSKKAEYSSLIKKRNQYTSKIQQFDEQLNALVTGNYKSFANLQNEMTQLHNEIALKGNTIQEIELSISELKKTSDTKVEREKLKLQLDNEKINLKQLQDAQNLLSTGSLLHPTVSATMKELTAEKEATQMLLEEITATLQSSGNGKGIIAPFAGYVSLGDGTVKLTSSNLHFVLTVNEKQMKKLRKVAKDTLQLRYDTQNFPIQELKSLSYDEEASLQANLSMYSFTYSIDLNNLSEILPNETAYLVIDEGLHIPKDYVTKKNKKYFVNIDGKEQEVKLEPINGEYLVKSGIKVGDLLEKAVEDND